MNTMSVKMSDIGGRLMVQGFVFVSAPTTYQNSMRELVSWEHADSMAREFGINPREIVWNDSALEWCKSQWGEIPEGI